MRSLRNTLAWAMSQPAFDRWLLRALLVLSVLAAVEIIALSLLVTR